MGCTVFGTSRTLGKLVEAGPLGLDFGIDALHDDFSAVVLRQTGGEGVHVVLDLVGGPAIEGNIAALATRGRLVLVGMLGGGTASVHLTALLRKRLTVVGTTLRARPLEEKILATRKFTERVVPWLERGLVRPIVDRVFPFHDVRNAQIRVESNLGFGKVILRL
jgi:NADPH:quinone reductase-like Zn-dependent oxidoreductase